MTRDLIAFGMRPALGAIVCLLYFSCPSFAQLTVTISEPATVKLEDLFNQADVVATVRILSGDTEQYPNAVYKAEVLKPFKGAGIGDRLFFGPYISYGLGSEYLVFLHRSARALAPTPEPKKRAMNYGPLQSFYEIMYQGYSVMPIDYTCVFDGKEISRQCGNGIKINISQVILPPLIKTFPSERDNGSGTDKRWVRKDVLLAILDEMKRPD
jgi:hypothetical protein